MEGGGVKRLKKKELSQGTISAAIINDGAP